MWLLYAILGFLGLTVVIAVVSVLVQWMLERIRSHDRSPLVPDSQDGGVYVVTFGYENEILTADHVNI